jgi:hypothetical protein
LNPILSMRSKTFPPFSHDTQRVSKEMNIPNNFLFLPWYPMGITRKNIYIPFYFCRDTQRALHETK